jgi:hypothetical protein
VVSPRLHPEDLRNRTEADIYIRSDWESAHELLNKAGVLTVPKGEMGVHLIDRLRPLYHASADASWWLVGACVWAIGLGAARVEVRNATTGRRWCFRGWCS